MLGFSPLAAAPLADDGAIGVAYSIVAANGSLAFTGQDATLNSVRSVDVDNGSFTLTGITLTNLSAPTLPQQTLMARTLFKSEQVMDP